MVTEDEVSGVTLKRLDVVMGLSLGEDKISYEFLRIGTGCVERTGFG